MNRKTILFFVLVLVAPFFFMCAQKNVNQKPPETAPLSTPTSAITQTPESQKSVKTTPQFQEVVVCENCHMNRTRQYIPQANRIPGHLNGIEFCAYCHAKGNDTVKAIGNLHHSKYSDCRKCHVDFNLKKMDCGKCHGYPDPFTPSNGNLLTIHLNRGVGCKSCHGDDFFRIHIKGKKFPEKFGIK